MIVFGVKENVHVLNYTHTHPISNETHEGILLRVGSNRLARSAGHD